MLATRPFLAADEPATFPRPYVKWSGQPDRAQDVPGAIAEAYRTAMAPPRGPVFVSVPEDDWDRPAGPVAVRTVHSGFVGDPAGLRAVAAALDGSRRPALVVGPGVDDDRATAAVVGLAERLGAAVWLEPLPARSGFPEDHRLFQGLLPPVRDQIRSALAGNDVVVTLGASVFKFHVHVEGPFLAEGTRLFHLDCDPAHLARLPAGDGVLTTVRAGVEALLGLVGSRERPAPPSRGRVEPATRRDPIDAAQVFDALRAALPAGAVIVEEAPSHRDAFHARVPITRPGGFLTTGSGALGWGLPVAVGRALAGTGERIVCVVGDGSSMYSIQALWTAARFHAPVTFVVLNNGGYEAVKQLGRRLGSPSTPGTDVPGIDFVALATGLGCPARRVGAAADLGGELAAALAADGPVLLEVPVVDVASSAYPEAGT
jgi:benzoylformate decarboxylase